MESTDFDNLANCSAEWKCFKCNTINNSTFTFHSFCTDSSSSFISSAHHTSSPMNVQSPNYESFSPPSKCSTPKSNIHQSTSNTPPNVSNITNASSEPCSLIRPPESFGNLRILNINCQSVRNKTAEFKTLLQYTKPDIGCGTESWLSKEIKSSEVFPTDEYQVFRKDRDKIGGGVFILVKENMIAIEQEDLSTNCEIIWIKLKLKKAKEILISSFYMPHRNLDDLNEFDRSLKLANPRGTKNVLVCGDFNCPDINWNFGYTYDSAQNKTTQDRLIDISNDNSLQQMQEIPTRDGNVLDLTFSTNPSLIRNLNNIPGLADHEAIIVDSYVRPIFSKKQKKKTYDFRKADWTSLNDFCEKLSSSITKKYEMNFNAIDLLDLFKSTLNLGISQFIPSKFSKKKSSLPWFNKHLEKLIRKKSKLHKKAKASGEWDSYKQHQKHCKKEFIKAENDYVNQIINKGLEEKNTKPFWKYIKSKKSDNIGVSPLKENCQLFSESKKKAEILLKQFKSVFTIDNTSKMPTVNNYIKDSITSIKIDKDGVKICYQD